MHRLDQQHTDQKHVDEGRPRMQVLLDRDRDDCRGDEESSLQVRGDDPVSELYIWGSKLECQASISKLKRLKF